MLQRKYAKRQPSGSFRGFKAYSDFRELLDRDDIDAVIIATGERWHPSITVRAARAGKDIYCEKPISLTIDGNRMEVAAGTTIMQAAEKLGVFIPRLCYHPYLSLAGACRVCIVAVQPHLSQTIGTPG